MEPTQETWRDIPGYDGCYQISDQGRVRSRKNHDGSAGDTWHLKRHGIGRKGYLKAVLWRGNRQFNHYVHTLVIEAFVGPRPPGMEVAHNNGDNTDNRPSNLRYATPKENQADRIAHGTAIRGEQAWNTKLTEQQVRAIRGSVGRTQQALADEYGVHRSTIENILNGANWRWLA